MKIAKSQENKPQPTILFPSYPKEKKNLDSTTKNK